MPCLLVFSSGGDSDRLRRFAKYARVVSWDLLPDKRQVFGGHTLIKKIVAFGLLFALIPKTAFAHAGAGAGFYAGLTHPIGGLDHLLAMLSVGILSTQIGEKHIWSVPATFVAVMLLGGLLGFTSLSIPMTAVEYGIIMSVVLLGLVIAMGGKMALGKIYLFVAIFGFFHGYAHGVELPELATPQYYASGFVVSSIMIHVVGVIIGYLYAVGGEKGMTLLRYSGACIMGAGLHMLLDSLM